MADAMLSLSSRDEVLSALGRAHDISVEAYTLHGAVLHAVEAAAQRGARVAVAFDGFPSKDAGGHLAAENRRLARELRASGATVTLAQPVHAKEIRADGELYLDEKNWDADDLVLREDDCVAARAIPAIKHEALAREAALLAGARGTDGVILESESFGCCNSVYGALAALARAGVGPRLLVSERDLRGNPRERKAIEELLHDGAQVRVCLDSEKLAVAGDRAWLGSANATVAFGTSDCIDWGLCTGEATIVDAVRDRLEAQWSRAKAYVSGVKPTQR